MALARIEPEATTNIQEPTALERYFQIESEIRESIESILKKHGENWTSWKQIKEDAALEVFSMGQESIHIGRYIVTLSRRPINMYPTDGGIRIGNKLRLSLHKG